MSDTEEDEELDAMFSDLSPSRSSQQMSQDQTMLRFSPQQLPPPQQAAAAMAAAMAAQQLLASAAAICGIDMATLSSIAMLAGQHSAAAAAAAQAGNGVNGSAGNLLNGVNLINGANAGSPLALNTNPLQPHVAQQLNEQLVSAFAEAAFRSPNHLVPEDLTVHQIKQEQQEQQNHQQLHQHHQQPQQQQPQAHPHHQHHLNQRSQQAARLQLQLQHQSPSSQQQQQTQQSLVINQNQNHSNNNNNNNKNHNGSSNNSSANHHHRHHHLLGGHHHHSSIQTQQQLLATQGFNPMAVVVGSGQQTEILTPTHLRKAKLMFFYVRYPNSSTLKECFRDVRFNKNNTAQLVKWFSNFREFYYIQMEKFARDAVADDRIQCKEDIVVNYDHELINQLNNHYNKNRHIELPEVFRQVVEETLRHFFDAIHHKRDQEQSWKKAIYKLIARLDQEVPEVFKTDAFNEHLE